ncbi:PREDICTED: uncharacterized protein LOC109590745, partial [Amphimedon queenslandica]|uniref:Death domain-containing protein n=1 Tax=Amphimedon queenslandica TaxID=400682 RepID=A0A1X7SYW8_AMPQE
MASEASFTSARSIGPVAMASSEVLSLSLKIVQLDDVERFLEEHGFSLEKWYKLGLRLGLHKNTLDTIECKCCHDLSRCLIECLAAWLKRADSVNLKGGATWDSLSDAVRAVNEIAVADEIDSKKCPHRHAITSTFNTNSHLFNPLRIFRVLQKEGIIAEGVLANVEISAERKKCEFLLDALKKIINCSS